MAGSKTTKRKSTPRPITREIVEGLTYEVEWLNKDIIFHLKQQGGRRHLAWERKLLEDARKYRCLKHCLLYAREIMSGNWPELEPLLIFDRKLLSRYLAMNPGSRRHPAFEKAILDLKPISFRYIWAAYVYARLAIQGRWKPGERMILEAIRLANYGIYSIFLVEPAEAYRKLAFPRKAWPDLIRMIRAGECPPEFAYHYCVEARHKWKDEVAEGLINTPVADDNEAVAKRKKDRLAHAAFCFARHVINGRWEAGEKLLGEDPSLLCLYAMEVVKGRLPDHLQNEIVMRSFVVPTNPDIKEYIDKYGI